MSAVASVIITTWISTHQHYCCATLYCRFEAAADCFDVTVSYCMDDNLLSLNTPSVMLNSVLCWICLGVCMDSPGRTNRLPVCLAVCMDAVMFVSMLERVFGAPESWESVGPH